MSNEPGRIRVEPDQQLTSHREAGKLHLLSEGRIKVTLRSIRCVDVHGITDLETHQITRAFGSVSHFLRFANGGEVRFAYNAAGALLEFVANDVEVGVIGGDRIVLRQPD
ncbi:hypothetical protein [Variovorax ginsengisoli]|uniref:Uncharacterized protein n=1 Tax=Variovorax ginsengisoli TaxID=363844 RepID=A0ABT9SBW3_9BURK|nr:hypothetical protein [Variovorax ginsengisoli]MDP9901828.1 hypothetical protein [Variovorax ginsengisoli]